VTEKKKEEAHDIVIRPRGARVLVKIEQFKYTGMIEIPQEAQRRPTTGIVKAVGTGVEGINIGDRVIFGVFAGTLLKFQNQPVYQLLADEEVLAILDSETEVEALAS
jgi:co-chaperonin GroES (HSP10)